VFSTGTGEIEGLSGFLVVLGWSLAAAAGAVGIGALAHTVMGRTHAVAGR